MSVTILLRRLTWVVVTYCSLVAAASRFDVPHELRWIPFGTRDYFVSAALDENDLPIVIYDPLEISDIPDQLAIFMLLREERVALLAREMIESGVLTRRTLRRERGPRYSNTSGRFAVIEEENVYEHLALREPALSTLDAPSRLSCLAYLQLAKSERLAVVRQYEAYVASGRMLTFGQDARGKTSREFRGMAERCEQSSRR